MRTYKTQWLLNTFSNMKSIFTWWWVDLNNNGTNIWGVYNSMYDVVHEHVWRNSIPHCMWKTWKVMCKRNHIQDQREDSYVLLASFWCPVEVPHEVDWWGRCKFPKYCALFLSAPLLLCSPDVPIVDAQLWNLAALSDLWKGAIDECQKYLAENYDQL